MVLRRADGAFRSVRILYIGRDKLPLQLQISSQIEKWLAEKWLAALVVHSDGVNGDAMSSKKLDSSPQRDSCVFRPKADEGLYVDISPVTTDLQETRARRAGSR